MVKWASEPVRRKKATKIPNEVWERHKDVILREYYAHGHHGQRSLVHVQNYMLRHHQFTAERSQWTYRLYTLWKVAQLPPPVPGTTTASSTSEHSSFTHGSDIRFQYHAGSVLPSTPIHEEDEGNLQYKGTPPSTPSVPETADISDTIPFLERRPFKPSAVYTGNSRRPSPSSRGGSPDERNASATFSYFQQKEFKRTASVSSKSSAPSLKRFKRSSPQTSISAPIEQDDKEEGQANFSQIHWTSSMVDYQSDSHSFRSQCSTSALPEGIQFKPNPNPLTIRKEIVFLCSSSTSKPSTFVRIRTVNPYALPDQYTDDEQGVKITSLSWDDMRQLKAAAEVFTAARMYRQAFNIHYQICSRLNDSAFCPWGDANELTLRQLLTCSRTPDTNLDLQMCRNMLNYQLYRLREDINYKESGDRSELLICMALADICVKQGDWSGAHVHRTRACDIVGEVDKLPELSTGNAASDLITNHVFVRAYAFRASMDIHLQNPKAPSKVCRQDVKASIEQVVNKVWPQLARAQWQSIRKTLIWCRFQLSSISQDELKFLRSSIGREPSTILAIKRLNIATIFGLFLMREHTTSFQPEAASNEQTFGIAAHRAHGLDNTGVSSAEDVLWMLAAVIVECMGAITMRSVLSKTYITKALQIATALTELDCKAFSDRIFSSLNVELTPLRAQQPRELLDSSPDDPCLGAAAKLVMEIVRRYYGVVLEGVALDLEEPYRPIFENYYALSLGPSPVTDASAKSKRTSDPKSVAQRDSVSTMGDFSSGSYSNRSSRSSMKRIKEQMKHSSSLSWKDSMQKAPSKFVRDTWRKSFNRAPSLDGICDMLTTTSVSDLPSPGESVCMGMDLNTSSPFRTGLKPEHLRDIHELVDQVLSQR